MDTWTILFAILAFYLTPILLFILVIVIVAIYCLIADSIQNRKLNKYVKETSDKEWI